MAISALQLGPVVFETFEVPEEINFGGDQRVVIHRMPGGDRVIDVMGRDDADVTWSGTFSGGNAAGRARQLDLLRAYGESLSLTWDNFYYTVVIREFTVTYRSAFWLPYRIKCTVLRDEAQGVVANAINLTQMVLDDLAQANSIGVEVTASQIAMVNSGAAIAGTAAYSAGVTAVGSAATAVDAGIASAGAALTSTDFTTILVSLQKLAQLTAARGFLARAASNLAHASN